MTSKGHIMKLGDVITLLSGNTPSKSEEKYWGGEFPWASAKDMKQFFISQTQDKLTVLGIEKVSKVIPANTTLILTRGMTLVKDVPICVVNQKSSFNQDLKAVIPKGGVIEIEFVPYLLLGNKAKIHSLVDLAGHGTGRLATDSLLDLEVYIPEQQDRRKMICLFQGLDKKIQLNHQTNQTLEHIAQTLFKSWFVDFEPTRAKIAAKQVGQDPERAAMAVISGKTVAELERLDSTQLAQLKTTAALFPDGLVESELGDVPEGWKVKPFGNCLSMTIGGDWGKEQPDLKHTEKVKILRGTDLPKVYFGSDKKVPIRFVEAKKLASRKLFSGDIVIEVSGGSKNQPTGRSLFLTQEIVDRLGCDLAPASFCRLFRPNNPEVGLLLGLHLQLIYKAGKTWLYQNQSTGISNFQTKVFLEKELIVIPSEELQKCFSKKVLPLVQQLSSCENQRLEKLRDTLLPKLLSGELSPTQPEVA